MYLKCLGKHLANISNINAVWITICDVCMFQLETIANQMSPDGEYVDWRAFLLAAAHPWPIPSQQDLLDTLQQFKEMDQQNEGVITREQYDRVSVHSSP